MRDTTGMEDTAGPCVRHRVRREGGPPTAGHSARGRRPSGVRRLAVITAALTLLALLGKAVSCDCQAVQAMLEVWRHLQRVGI